MTVRLVVLGAGGHARSVVGVALDALNADPSEIVVLDNEARPGETILGCRVVKGVTADAIHHLGSPEVVVAVGDCDVRAAVFDRICALGFAPATLIHPSATVMRGSTVGKGTVVHAGSVIGAAAVIGRDCIVNSGAVVDHETTLGDHAHVGPGSRLAGRVTIGSRAFVGLGACVRDRGEVGERAIVGAGAVVVQPVGPGEVVAGVPARHLRMVDPPGDSRWKL